MSPSDFGDFCIFRDADVVDSVKNPFGHTTSNPCKSGTS